jgi:hypothetical protein
MRSLRAIVCAAVALALLGTGPSALLGAGRLASAVGPLENLLPKETVVFASVRAVPQFLEKAKPDRAGLAREARARGEAHRGTRDLRAIL